MRSHAADKFRKLKGAIFTLTKKGQLQEWYTVGHKNDKGATELRFWAY